MTNNTFRIIVLALIAAIAPVIVATALIVDAARLAKGGCL